MNEPNRRPSAVEFLVPMMLHGTLGALILARLLYAGPRYARLFDDFNMALPTLTQATLNLFLWVTDRMPVLLALLPSLLLIDAGLYWLLGGWSHVRGRWWLYLVGLALAASWGCLEFSWAHSLHLLSEGLAR